MDCNADPRAILEMNVSFGEIPPKKIPEVMDEELIF